LSGTLGAFDAQVSEGGGGPGIQTILERLKESDSPLKDRRTYLKAQMVFWLPGATDGHAKNFSIAHRPGGGFRLTPLYDILSAQPLVDAGKMRRNRFTIAMSIGAKNHYRMDEIRLRHFTETADTAGLPVGMVEEICAELEREFRWCSMSWHPMSEMSFLRLLSKVCLLESGRVNRSSE
jgi:serine/threonine-protein kinase HipA